MNKEQEEQKMSFAVRMAVLLKAEQALNTFHL